jgi:hypothetical protein
MAVEVGAHPMPNSMVALKIYPSYIEGELQLPLGEFEFAFGHHIEDSAEFIIRFNPEKLKSYFLKHIGATGVDGRKFKIDIGEMAVVKTQNAVNGVYKEMIVQFSMQPLEGQTNRQFKFDYDVIIHQLITHKILVSVAYDWGSGIIEKQEPSTLGVIELDIRSGTVKAFDVALEEPSYWKNWFAFFKLGIKHIIEGIDHLLFLLLLLLPTPLVVQNKQWLLEGNSKSTLRKLFKIVTAFTIGHSFTLLFGAFGFIPFSSYWIEILIVVSILASACHAWRPLFPKKEIYVAILFGLIHGMAFANILAEISKDRFLLVSSVFSFNLGIEFIQLIILAFSVPVILYLSRKDIYRNIRVTMAVIAMGVAMFWLFQRV